MSGKNSRIVAVMTIVFCLAAGSIAGPEDSHQKGMRLFIAGKYEEAAKELQAAYEGKSSDPGIAFDYARLAHDSLAVAIYTKLSGDEKVPDSLRAASYGKLGDYSFVHSAFKTAAERYRLASTLDSDAAYRHRWALSAAALHDYKTARSVWHTITLEHGTSQALKAQYHLGTLDMEAGNYDSAIVRFTRAGAIDAKRSWTIAATAAKLECAIKLGKKDSVAVLEKRLEPYRDELLEKDLVGLAAIRADKPLIAPTKTGTEVEPSDNGDKTEYTLQVGAFGSLENASALQDKLDDRFSAVTVLPVTLSDQVFYRVRIGTFASKTAAETFGNDSLTAAGIAFKAVVK